MPYPKHKIKPLKQDLDDLEVFEIDKNGQFTPLDSNTLKPFIIEHNIDKNINKNITTDQNLPKLNIKDDSTQKLISNMKDKGIINEKISVEEFSKYPSKEPPHKEPVFTDSVQSNIKEESNIEKSNIAKSNIEKSNIEESNIEESNIAKSNIEKSNIAKSNIEESTSEKQNFIKKTSFVKQHQEEQHQEIQDSKTQTKENKDVLQENIIQDITTKPNDKIKTSNEYDHISDDKTYDDKNKKSSESLHDETFENKESSHKESSHKETSKEHNKLFVRIKPDKVYKILNVDQLIKDNTHLENKFAALFKEFLKEDISFATPINITPQKRELYLLNMDNSVEQYHQKLLSIIESGEEVQVDSILNIMIYYAQNSRYYEGLKLLLLFDLEALGKDIFYVLLGDCYYNTGETKNALNSYNKALEINHLSNSAYFSLAFLHFEQKEYNEALNCAYKAKDYKNLNKNALALLQANALKETNESEQALAKYCQYLKNSFVDDGYIYKYILLNIADILYNINLFEKAIIYYTKVKEENDEQEISMSIRTTEEEKVKIDYRLAICYFMSGLYELCLNSLSRFINQVLKDDKEKDVKKIGRETTNAELMSDILYGFKDAFNNGVYDQNISFIFKKLLTDLNLSVLDFLKDKLETDNVSDNTVLMDLADIAIQSKNFKLASLFLKKILKDDPNNLKALLLISKIYYDYEHDKEKACKVFIYLEKHKSTDVFVDKQLGKYYFSKKDYENAMQALSRCIQSGEYDFETLFYLGKSLYALGKENKALNYLKKAYLFEDDKNQEQIANILTLLGKIYLNKGEYKKGIEVLKKALKINNTLTECHQTLTSIYKKILEDKQEEHYSKYIDLEVKDKNDP